MRLAAALRRLAVVHADAAGRRCAAVTEEIGQLLALGFAYLGRSSPTMR